MGLSLVSLGNEKYSIRRSAIKWVAVGSFIIMSASISGCATSGTAPQKSNLTVGTVKKTIVKGQTRQSDVVQTLGSPNIVTKNSKGEEVWTYSRQSFDSESGSYGGGVILFGGHKAFSSSASASFDLIITFDKDDVVKDYSVVSSQF